MTCNEGSTFTPSIERKIKIGEMIIYIKSAYLLVQSYLLAKPLILVRFCIYYFYFILFIYYIYYLLFIRYLSIIVLPLNITAKTKSDNTERGFSIYNNLLLTELQHSLIYQG